MTEYRLKKKFYRPDGVIVSPQELKHCQGNNYKPLGYYVCDMENKVIRYYFGKEFVETNKEFFEEVKEDSLEERINSASLLHDGSLIYGDEIEAIKQLIKDEVRKSLKRVEDALRTKYGWSSREANNIFSTIKEELKRIDKI